MSIERGSGARALKVRFVESASLKVENVLRKQKSVIDLNHYMIVTPKGASLEV